MDDVPASEPEGTGSDPGDPAASVPQGSAASPYSTGSGGVTLERRVAVLYLAALLTGETFPELGDSRSIVSVKFQQAPRVPIDDLVIEAKREDEIEGSVVLAIGIRRRPSFVPSHDDTQKLVVELVRALLRAPNDGREHRLGIAVAGRQTHAEQVAELASLARNQMSANPFFDLVEEDGRFRQRLSDRLGYVKEMVAKALATLEIGDADDDVVRDTTWRLLSRLFVLMLDVEEPNVSGWTAAQNRLISITRSRDLIGAGQLLERLETLAGQYGPSAATVDRRLLRRDVHSLLDAGGSRTGRGWELLNHLQQAARVRDRLGEGDEGSTLHFDRNAEGVEIIAAADDSPAVLVTGESGVGKSALVMDAAAAAVGGAEGETEIVSLNLRQLPQRSFDLVSQLGASLETLLSDLSAPRRLLVVDAADAVTEGWSDVFGYLVDAARTSDVGLIAVTSNEGRQVVHDVIKNRMHGQEPVDREVTALNDEQLNEIAERFPSLARLVANDRSRELLKRLIVVDLLVRSEFSGTPLSDTDAMNQVWGGLVRRHGRQDRGTPDAREQTLLRLANRELTQGSRLDLANELDPTALDGLRRDGLLRSPEGNPWQAVPDFAHDEIRRYAVARVLLADGDPAAAILNAGAPRWALSAARLACQAVLAQSDRAENRLQGRFDRVQSAFDTVVDAGHGARWADVPNEALLTLGDPSALLIDTWPALRSGDQAGLRRLIRIAEQRHGDSGTVDPVVVEPIIILLLEDAAPWRGADEIAKLLRHWLRALVVRDVAAGHPLRVLLRERLLTFCEQAEAAQRAHEEEIAAARAAMTDEERDAEQARAQARPPIPPVLGLGPARRRRRPELPLDVRDDTLLELLALLGPDLGGHGERLLRRVAEDAPWDLRPAIEEPATGRAIASYGHGLLADLVEAYYFDDNEDDYGSGLLDDGIRRHTFGGVGMPLAAWYRGPFLSLFQTDFRRGVTVLNRLLNHAARERIRTLASIGDRWNRLTDEQINDASVELRITGVPQKYAGDPHVWLWYRGTGVGPYPCMSALQALERVCDQTFALGLPMDPIIGILMEGCQNLAMPALVVGLLVRHIENAGTLLDPYLAEPHVWQLEFSRSVNESVGLAASSEGLAAPERRTWSFREAASWLALNADPERADALRLLGEQLVSRARENEADHEPEGETPEDVDDDASSPSFTTLVAGWASALDRSRYRAYEEDEQVYVQGSPPEDVEEALRPGNEELRRGNEVVRIQWRYYAGGGRGRAKTPPPVGEELVGDLAIAEALVANPPTASAVNVSQMTAAIAAHAAEVVVLRDETLPEAAKKFAVNGLLTVAEHEEQASPFDYYGSLFEQGADRVAARAIPLLLLPAAAELRGLVDADEQRAAVERIEKAALHLARAVPNETRVHLARGLDAVWTSPCVDEGRCHHEMALDIAVESMRDCVLGPWDTQTQRRRIDRIADPVAESLDAIPNGAVFVPRLDAGIRALGVAATQPTCVTEPAKVLLAHVLDAQRRGLLAYDKDFDDRNTHTLQAARALLNLSATGDDAPVHEAVAAYADNSARLGGLLRGLAAAGEETQSRADAACRLWPTIIDQVLELHAEGRATFDDRYYGRTALTSMMPTPSHDIEFLYRELGSEPIRWTDPLAWEQSIDAWIAVGAGDSGCVDALVELVGTLPPDDQMRFGLPRVAALVTPAVEDVARRSFLLSTWLKDTRQAAVDAGVEPAWQQLVDALVVAGDQGLAPYSE
jgi:hypothetical protein